jgi:ADP-heptose:LPS heptosyltransferase
LTLPALSALRKLYPKARIELLATDRNAEVYRRNEDIDAVVKVGLNPWSIFRFSFSRAKRYDLVIDMEEYLNISALMAYAVGKHRVGYSHGGRSLIYHRQVPYNDRQHAAQTILDLIRALGSKEMVKELLPLKTSPIDEKLMQKVVGKKIGKGKIVVIAPGAAESAKARMWPSELYAELSDYILHQYPSTILFTGTDEEKPLIEAVMEKMDGKGKVVNLAGKLSLRSLRKLICL